MGATILKHLEGDTRHAISSKFVTWGTIVYFASTPLATNIPSTRDGIAILAIIRDGTATTVVEIKTSVDAFKVTAG